MSRRAHIIFSISATLLAVLLVAAGVFWLFAPRTPADLTITFDPSRIGDDPAAYVARTEADVPNLRPEAAKQIVWAYPASQARTPLAIVYVHGYSASKDELRPLPDLLAKRFGANLFYTRLAGHGRNGVAMREASVNDWINDLAEAVAVGRRIGERVIVVGNSTGGTLAALGAADPKLAADMAGLVLISPNFGVRDRWAFVLDLPFADRFGPRLFGEEWGPGTSDPRVAAVWTMRFPTVALLTMGALVRAARHADFGSAKVPALFVYAPGDKVVDPAETRAVIERWRAPRSVIETTDSGDPNQHILAGDLLSPGTTPPLAKRIGDWIETLPKQPSAAAP